MALPEQSADQSNKVPAQAAFSFLPVSPGQTTTELNEPPLGKAPEAHARRTDPQTSHAAAASVSNIRQSQQYILGFFKQYGPMTDEQLQARISRASSGTTFQTVRLSPSGIRTRRSELVTLGMLRDSGNKLALQSGRKAIVWSIA